MTTVLSPLPVLQFFDDNSVELSGGLLFTYAAGTTTKINTYTDSTGATPNTNPIILDSRGDCKCWLQPSIAYKLVLSPANDTDPPTNPFWTVDNIFAPGTGGVSISPTIGSVSNVTVSSTYNYIPINNTTGAPFTVKLPASPANGEQFTFKDIGLNAFTNNITISGNGNNIDGDISVVMNVDGQALTLTYVTSSSEWGIS